MKIKRLSKKKLIIPILVLIAVIGGGSAYAYFQSQQKAETKITSEDKPRINTVDLNPPTQEQINAGNEIEKEAAANQSAPAAETVGVTISAANQNGTLFQIRTLIEGLTSSGTCTLHMTKNGQTVEKVAETQALASSSTCKGFDVPVNELSAGTWNITITVTAGSKKGSATQDVVVT